MNAWNRGRFCGMAAAMLLALSACGGWPDQAPDQASAIDEPGVPKQLRARQIIVALPDRLRGEWPAIDRDLQARYRLRPVGEFPLTSIGVQCLVYQVPIDQPLDEVIAQLQADSRVELAQPNQTFEELQTGSRHYVALAYGAKLIRADRAQQLSTGQGVSVAVIDTGAAADHPDLRGRVDKTATFVEGGEPSFPRDRHGTAVAGVIGGRAHGAGLEGVAPNVRLTVAKACWYPEPGGAKARCSSWTLAKAVDFAIGHGVKVLNLSLGGSRADPLLTRLLHAAHRRGVTVVAATLEGGNEPGFPAALDTVIPVIACDAEGRVTRPHWQNPGFVVAAPGVEVVAPIPDSGYALMSGSSLAAAHVTGVVALLLQQAPQLSPDQIKTVLQTTAKPVAGADPVIGLVDACAALAQEEPRLACR